ncbi:DUF2852 domain-containing protein [Ahrensia sp. R2A130]|uniref:DUF2852 domain-containing protein n=1 Tax=Ahrensia sp. R2A130 TaxID=744979 RepID=UPI0001E0CA57|nr:DUF2852 domain-containing protein [Ahrensia sp. R2A130]EFL87649.1 putative cytoplasmic protein [Ahrensia sp. R2A130]
MTNALLRPAWTPATIAAMIIGFMIFWPLGLAMLAYIIWGDRLDKFKTDINDATDKAASFVKSPQFNSGRTGNVAFDDWREAELDRLHKERMKLDGMRAEFDDYARELRRAKDAEEFETFMASRATEVDNQPAAKPVKSTKKVKSSGGKTVPGV